ncbi:MAG: winged helix-turn-helix transcriptional regulator [Chloroflexi bacterium]|nr:winged helix-turn-helix transcriptional regulator [Chloroflexota bacterium]
MFAPSDEVSAPVLPEPAFIRMPVKRIVSECGVRLDLGLFTAVCGAMSLDLTAREFDLLRVLLEVHGRVISRAELHQRVWRAGDSKARVVDTYISRLRRKLTAAGHPGIRSTHMRGYRILNPAD